MDFELYIKTLKNRLDQVNHLLEKDELCVSFDRLKIKKKVNHELLYFKDDGIERTGLFIFGADFFLKELGEQEFKRVFGQNTLNFKIIRAYSELSKSKKKVKITEILNKIQDDKKDSNHVHKILRRILTMSYYLNWELEKDKGDLEQDSFIKIPTNFLMSLTQRFNFDVSAAVYENRDFFIFLNSRNKLNLVFKTQDLFTKKDIEEQIFPILKRVFKLKKVKVERK